MPGGRWAFLLCSYLKEIHTVWPNKGRSAPRFNQTNILWSGVAFLCQVSIQQSYVPQKWGLTTRIHRMTRFSITSITIFFPLLWWNKYFSMMIKPGFILGINCQRVVWGAWEIFTWTGHYRIQILTPLQISGMWKRKPIQVKRSHHQH